MARSPGSPPLPEALAEAARDPQWLAHRYDPEYDAFHFLRLARPDHDRVAFLTKEHLPADREPRVIARSDALASGPETAPIHFLFHSGYCCSTLMARLFDRAGWAMALKEPTILNDIVGWRRRGGRGADMAQVLDDTLTLLSRPFERGEAIVVKPSTAVNGLAAAMLTLRPQAHALLLYAPLRVYLGSIAKKGIDGRLWVRTLLTGMLDDKSVELGFAPRDYLGQTDLQVAAVGWLANQALFASLAARFGGERIRSLDSQALMADVPLALTAGAEHFGLAAAAETVRAITDGPVLQRHSKSNTAFDAADRAAEHHAAAELHADEIAKVAHWAEVIAEKFAVPMDAPAPPLIA